MMPGRRRWECRAAPSRVNSLATRSTGDQIPLPDTIAPLQPGPARPDQNRAGQLPSFILIGATIAFLALPVAIFLFGWLRNPWAWLSVTALVASASVAGRRLAGPAVATPSLRSAAAWAPLLGGSCLLVLVVSVCGPGGAGVQSWDWPKHNAILADLVEQPWPVAYRLGSPPHDVALVYYIAYYLPAALVGSACGWHAAHATLFLWTALGLILAWQWIARLGRASPWTSLLVVLLFTGFDLAGALLASPRFAAGGPWWREPNLVWWQGRFVYPGNLTQLLYAPNQALGGWLASALTLEALRRRARSFPLVLPLTLCLLWSPFAALGLAGLIAAFALAPALSGWMPRLSALRRQLSVVTLLAIVGVTLPLVLYYAARLSEPGLPADLRPPAAAAAAARLSFLPAALGPVRFAVEWARFLGIELLPLVGALAGLLWLARGRGGARFDIKLLAAAAALLAGIPLLSYGYYNDWVMRVAIAPLFALQVLAARALSRRATPVLARRAFALLLLAAGLYPLAQLRMQVAATVARGRWLEVPARVWVTDLFTLQRGPFQYYGFVEQYLGRTDAPFFRLLSRGAAARPIGTDPYPPQAASGSRGEIFSKLGATGSSAKRRAGYRASRLGIDANVKSQRAAHISFAGSSTPPTGMRNTRGYSSRPRSEPNS